MERRRRYYLHWVCRAKGYKINAHARTVCLNYQVDTNTIDRRIYELRDQFGYAIQTEIV